MKVLWKATFCKPYLNFIQFLEKLNNQGVALENFSIEIDTEILSGSVKVRNFSFEKAVVVRVSDNDWQSYRDYPCTYRSDQHSTAYDTFTFEIPLGNPSEMMNRVEFCIRFKSASSEFWDNNNGANYQLVRESAKLIAEQQDSTVRKNLKTVDVPKVRSIRSNHINGSLTCGYIGFKPHFATNYTPTDKLICR